MRRPLGIAACCIAAPLCAMGAAARAHAQRPLNLDFTIPSVAYADRPWGWSLGWSAFAPGTPASFDVDTTRRAAGGRALRIVGLDSSEAADPPLRAMSLQLPAAFARGRTLVLRGELSGAGLSGRAVVQLQAWGDRRVPAADSTMLAPGQDDGGWHPFTLTIAVPANEEIHSVYLALGVAGTGSAWFGGLSLTLDGVPLAALPPDAPPPTDAQQRWLATRAAPLRALSVPLPGAVARDADLALFDRIVGDAQVVGLGESTHGTREFFLVKHRLLEHLVRTRGFSLFAIEANQLAVERLNHYVMGGPGTAREAMRVLFRVWNTEEMHALVEWARRHNSEHPTRPLRFVGYDMQDHRLPVDSLLALARRVEPAFAERVAALSHDYRAQAGYTTPQLPDSTRAAWFARADSLWRETSGRRQRWLAAARSRVDTVAVEWGVQNANHLRQAAHLNVTLNSPDRDSLMAANLDWALRVLYPGARTVVWAHDVHVSRGGDGARSFNAGAQLGAHLEHTYRHDYRAFSLLTRAGAYSATRNFSDHEIIAARAWPAPMGSIEQLLAGIPRPRGTPGLVVDLRIPEGDAAGGWLWQPRSIRHVGYAAYDYAFEMRAVLPLEFHGAVFVDVTEPSRVLAR